MSALAAEKPVCPHHDAHVDRIESLEERVERHERFHSWWEMEKVGDKITKTYNLLIGLVFLHGAVAFLAIVIAIKKGLF